MAMAEKSGPTRVALVTGGSRGIGAGIVRRLAADGFFVAFTYLASSERAQELVESIAAAGGLAFAIQADSGLEGEVRESVSRTFKQFGRLDVLVNNAGVSMYKPLGEFSSADVDLLLNVNVRSTIAATQEALKHLTAGGRIINIGSVNADRMPWSGGSVYSLTKGAVAAFTRGLSRELGPLGITVNNIQPGPVDTDNNPADGPAAQMELGFMAVERFGTTDEIAGFVSYLASAEASFVTGATMTIDGGLAA
jgi:3-oxoacyl-[acyl-carrier protein] reductase